MTVIHYIGLDVHKKTISYCIKAADGRIVQEGKLAATRPALHEWAKAQRVPWHGAMEATLFSAWIYDTLKPYAERLVMGHPARMKAITAGKKKSDSIDAIGKQRQRLTRKRKQDVVTRLRCAAHHAFEQAGIARRKGGGRREQIAPAAENSPAERRTVLFHAQTRRNASVPLVPPKPNELEIATSILASRAVFGTKSRSQPSLGSSRLIVGGST